MLSETSTSESPELDADALNWQARIVDNGGAVSETTLTAVSDFCIACKSAGIWNKLLRVNLFCGDDFICCLIPQKAGSGFAIEEAWNFVSGDYSEATGLQGAGSAEQKYINTGLVPGGNLTANSTHLSVYNRSSTASSSAFGAITSTSKLQMHYPWEDGVFYSDQYDSSSGRASADPSSVAGYYVASRIASNDHRIYQNGTQLTLSTSSGGSISSVTHPIFIFASNQDGSPNFYTPYLLGGYTIGSGLTPSDVAALDSAMQAFQSALSRAV